MSDTPYITITATETTCSCGWTWQASPTGGFSGVVRTVAENHLRSHSRETDKPAWYESHDEVVSFAYVLEQAGEFWTASCVIGYFEKPWKWNREHQLWEAHGSPMDSTTSRAFFDALADLERTAL